MTVIDRQREQAAAGLEQLVHLARAQAWRGGDGPALPPTQAGVLRLLSGAEPEQRAQRLAQRLGVSAASLSDTLKSMEARGWIRRRPDPTDGRAALVRLDRQGRAAAARLADAGRGMAGLVRGLDNADVAALLRVTQLLVAQAQEQGWATGLRTCLGCRYFQPFASGDAQRPHVCEYIGQPFGDLELRVECAEQQPADPEDFAANLERFRQPVPP